MIDKSIVSQFSSLIYDSLGVRIPESKYFQLEYKLERIVRKEKFKDLKEFYNIVSSGDKVAFECLVRNITTNHTFFFRESAHFTYLVEEIKSKGISKPIIWVAGSSSGEEVYTIAIELLENHLPNFTIIASDIDLDMLVKVKKGEYSEDRVEGLTEDILKKYFIYNKSRRVYKVKDLVKNHIRVKRLNFIENITFEGQFDYVFCRNVLIYFDRVSQRKVVINLLKNLKNNGRLFLGHSENLLTMTDLVTSVEHSIYRKSLNGKI
ncbi:MAG: hypothetical protein B6229_10350 [Spirochaetaceae bacterium 4572_7]|nr:MAG: hypothetical protein B6229_10350 [Spirochaetaceae bacterium 4572_7]